MRGDDPATTEVVFDARLHSLLAIKKAAYRLLGRATIGVQLEGDSISCQISPAPDEDIAVLARDFRNEVLDQDLRDEIAAETAPLRNAILAHVFSKTGLQE